MGQTRFVRTLYAILTQYKCISVMSMPPRRDALSVRMQRFNWPMDEPMSHSTSNTLLSGRTTQLNLRLASVIMGRGEGMTEGAVGRNSQEKMLVRRWRDMRWRDMRWDRRWDTGKGKMEVRNGKP